jgi:hypothetical protein
MPGPHPAQVSTEVRLQVRDAYLSHDYILVMSGHVGKEDPGLTHEWSGR